MLNESKPTLSDGTRIEDLINVETREVSMRLQLPPQTRRGQLRPPRLGPMSLN